MKKILYFEIKRLLNRKSTIILSIVCPILILVILSGTILPHLFEGAVVDKVSIAIYNESPDDETIMIINHLTKADSIEDFVSIIKVDSLDEGLNLLDDKKASALIHLPDGLQETLMQGGIGEIFFYEGDINKQVVDLLYSVLESGIKSINSGQQAVEYIYLGMRDMGYSYSKSADTYNDRAIYIFSKVLNRIDVFEDNVAISAYGNLINIEYYSISIVILFTLLCGIIIASLFSSDISSGILERGLPCKKHYLYVLYKMLSGTVYTAIISSILLLSVLIIAGSLSLFSGNIILIIITNITLSIYASIIMLLIGSFTKSVTSAIWASFTYCFITCFASGIFIPSHLLPKSIKLIAEVTGIPAISRMFSNSLYGIRDINYLINFLIVLTIIIISYLIVSKKIKRRYCGK